MYNYEIETIFSLSEGNIQYWQYAKVYYLWFTIMNEVQDSAKGNSIQVDLL